MNIPEPTRYIANELKLNCNELKEVEPHKKKELNNQCDKLSTIIIDYGSETIKAGLENTPKPELVYRSQISKNRDLSKGELPAKAFINTSYDQLDFLKNNFKSPY